MIDHGSSAVRPTLPSPTELTFSLSAEAEKYVKEAREDYDKLVGAHDMQVRSFPFSKSMWDEKQRERAFGKRDKKKRG